ncbi:proline-rich protein 34-like [Myiozetetes cayanensis]|uniref:proline-rich protein 34-like n=1 Tax=Myiozetetes cayanensis TaxID=478635 RepID=UPI002160127E|nr:proline-rich protein 34-like [Myiozetetes cayanensis]
MENQTKPSQDSPAVPPLPSRTTDARRRMPPPPPGSEALFIGGDATEPGRTPGRRGREKRPATKGTTGGAPSLLAAGSLLRRAASEGPRRPHPSDVRGSRRRGGGTNSPKSSQKPGTTASG